MKTFADFGINIGNRTGEIKATCPQCSNTRKKKSVKCLSVNTEKEVWLCWHCDWQGGLKNGIEGSSEPHKWAPKTYTRPSFKLTDLPDKVIEWFKTRGISEGVLKRNRIAYDTVYMPQEETEVSAIQFPYHRKGETVNIKYRDGKKNFRMASGAERILYGLDDITGDEVIIVEGEIDKLSLEMAGYKNALSVPDGAPSVNTKNYEKKFDYLESAAELLERMKTIILAVDNDEPGKKLEEELARRLGKERCKRVMWPDGCKDANEVLVKHGSEVLKECVLNSQPYPVRGIFEVRDMIDQIQNFFKYGVDSGENPGWPSLAEYYTVRPGEWTLVTGIPSHGKSEFIDAIMINLAERNQWSFAIYSPENQPLERHIAKLMEKYVGLPFREFSQKDFKYSTEFLDSYFSFILPDDEEDSHTLDSILDLARIQVFRRGIKGLVIDPWNELDHSRPPGLTETEYISQSISKIRRFARKHDVHVWLIAHPTKLQKNNEGNYPVPTPYDVAGSAHWRNKADNALAIWRDLGNASEPVQIHIQKIRFKEIGKVGMIELKYNFLTGRYSEISSAYEHEEVAEVEEILDAV